MMHNCSTEETAYQSLDNVLADFLHNYKPSNVSVKEHLNNLISLISLHSLSIKNCPACSALYENTSNKPI